MKKLFAILLSVCLVFGCFPLIVSAAEGDTVVISSQEDVENNGTVISMNGNNYYQIEGNVLFSGADNICIDANIYVTGETVTVDTDVTVELYGELRNEIMWSQLTVNGCLQSHGAIDWNMWRVEGAGSVFEARNITDLAYLVGETYVGRFKVDLDTDCASYFPDEEWIRPMLADMSEREPYFYSGLCMCLQYGLFDGLNTRERLPFDTVSLDEIKDFFNRLATLLAGGDKDALAKMTASVAGMPSGTVWFPITVHQEEDMYWTESAWNNYVEDFKRTVPRVSCDRTEIQISFEEHNGDMLLVTDLSDGNCIEGLVFANPVTVRIVGDVPDFVCNSLDFLNCRFENGITAVCHPNAELTFRFNSCEYGENAVFTLAKDPQAQVVGYVDRSVAVESFNGPMPKLASEVPFAARSQVGGITFGGITAVSINQWEEEMNLRYDFRCPADHDDFDWYRNDHTECGIDVERVLCFNSDRRYYDYAVSGAWNGIADRVETFGCVHFTEGGVFGKNLAVYLYGANNFWNEEHGRWETRAISVDLNGNYAVLEDSCDTEINSTDSVVEVRNNWANVSVNGVSKPHIFGNGSGIFIGTAVMPQNISVFDDGEELYPDEFEALLVNEEGEAPTAEKPATKVHIFTRTPNHNWNPGSIRLSFSLGDTTCIYDPVYYKQYTYGQFAENITRRSGYPVDISAYNFGDEIILGDAMDILCQLWSNFDAPERFPGSDIRPEWYTDDFEVLDEWTATQMIMRTLGAMGMNAVDVHNMEELVSALNDRWPVINVVSDFTLVEMAYSYMDLRIEEGVSLHVKPGVTLTVGEYDHTVSLQVESTAEIVIDIDENDPDRHGKIRVIDDSEIRVYGNLNVNGLPQESWLTCDWDYAVVYYPRLGHAAAQIYEMLTASTENHAALIPELTKEEIAEHIGEFDWPNADDEGVCKGMAFLVKYLDLQPEFDEYAEQNRWPTWNLVTYGELHDTLAVLWHKLAEIDGQDKGDLPDWVRVPWDVYENNYISYGELGLVLGRFVDAYIGNYHTVRFVDYDGTELSVQQIVPGFMDVYEPDVPLRYGYEFYGWDIPFDSISEDTTVTAQYIRCSPMQLEEFDYRIENDGIVITGLRGYYWQVIINGYYSVNGKKMPVIGIDECAFDSNWGLRYVSIPETVTSIGDYAFYNCTSLEKAVVYNPNVALGEGVFGYYYITKKQDGINPDFIVAGYEGSTAQKYANATGLVFESLNPSSTAGDINADGRLDSTDVVLLKQAVLGASVTAACDVNGDGTVDVRDLVCLKKLLAE
ncbi:MAG: dockerin type I domain-containing protein [Clostridia bacterium]|nr:dockerin type I domain-containing protein [Clostridia bacterium]